MSANEFARVFDVRQCEGKHVLLQADAKECQALAARFGLVRIDKLEADMVLTRLGRDVEAQGTLVAEIVQSCAVSAEDLPVTVREQIAVRFVPKSQIAPSEEIELDAEDCDEIEYTGSEFDLGEAVAQSLALAIDPFATAAQAEEARKLPVMGGGNEDNPFAALKNLKL